MVKLTSRSPPLTNLQGIEGHVLAPILQEVARRQTGIPEMTLRTLMSAASAVVVLATAGAAGAAVTDLNFAGPGPQPQIYFNGFVPGTTTVDPHLSATLDLALTSVTAGGYQWNFSYNLANTSTAASRISAIGWDISTDFLSVVGVSGVFDTAASGQMSSLGSLDLCLKNAGGSNNCSGGGGGGLTMGQSGSGAFSLTFLDHVTTFITVQTPKYNNKGKLIGYTETQVPQVTSVAAPTSVAFNNFGMHLQGLDSGISTIAVPGDKPRDIGGIGGDIHDAVPEPTIWAMMIMGFGAVGATLRRRRPVLA